MKKGLILVFALIMAASILFSGCASKSADYATSDSAGYYAEDVAYDAVEEQTLTMDDSYNAETDYEEAYADESSGTNVDIENTSSILEPDVERKIIYTGYISAQTKNFDDDYENIVTNVEEVGGYIESAYISGTEPEEWQDEGRYAEVTLRVPSDQFDEFIDMLKGVGDTTYSSVSGTDISLQYFDLETKLETLRTREERLMALLEEAATLEDIIELERELADVSYEIQSYESEKRNYDSLIDYSQITVYLQEVAEDADLVVSEETLGESIKSGFNNVVKGLAVFGRWLLVVLVAGSPILAILAVALVIVLLSVRAARKKRERKQKEQDKGM